MLSHMATVTERWVVCDCGWWVDRKAASVSDALDKHSVHRATRVKGETNAVPRVQ